MHPTVTRSLAPRTRPDAAGAAIEPAAAAASAAREKSRRLTWLLMSRTSINGSPRMAVHAHVSSPRPARQEKLPDRQRQWYGRLRNVRQGVRSRDVGAEVGMKGRVLLIQAVAVGLSAFGPEAGAASESYFELKVRPILAGTCVKCHGEKKAEAADCASTREVMLAGGDGGPTREPPGPSGASFPATCQTRHLPVHARRAVAGRHLRSQTQAHTEPRQAFPEALPGPDQELARLLWKFQKRRASRASTWASYSPRPGLRRPTLRHPIDGGKRPQPSGGLSTLLGSGRSRRSGYSLAGPELPTIAEGDRGGTPW